MGASHEVVEAAEVHVLPARQRATTTTASGSARSRRASTGRTTASARRTGSTTSSTAAWSSSTAATSPGASEAGQQQFQEFFDTFPPSPICELPAGRLSPVIARFDTMPYDYAALVWTRVLPMTEWDPSLALEFYETESERLDADGAFVTPPEPQCLAPSPSPGASQSAAPASTEPSPAASPLGRPGLDGAERKSLACGELSAARCASVHVPGTGSAARTSRRGADGYDAVVVGADGAVDPCIRSRSGRSPAGQDRLRRAELPGPRQRGRGPRRAGPAAALREVRQRGRRRRRSRSSAPRAATPSTSRSSSAS